MNRSETNGDPSSLVKLPTTKWCVSKQRKISKHLEGQKVHFPCYVLDTLIDWMSRERRTKVACDKTVPCSTGNKNSVTAKASEAISRVAQPAQLWVPLVFPNSICQYGLLWNMKYSSTDKNVMYSQGLKS